MHNRCIGIALGAKITVGLAPGYPPGGIFVLW